MEPKKRNLTQDAVLAAAVEITEKNGLESLRIRELAKKLGVKPPSLYNHIKGLDDARRRLACFALEKLEAALRDTALGYSREEALRKIARAYRCFAQSRPELYKAFTARQFSGGSGAMEAKQAAVCAFYKALEPYRLDYETKVHFIRSFRSALHGFVSLEGAGFFKNGVDAEKSFETLVEIIIAPLAQTRKENEAAALARFTEGARRE
ncbi:MAG: WHG domain-containing protein [Spirochaetaceae bacterium]|jgi:AcrR family transcriptional regulator|nr:WHG domain-containing protein [Spirochaetaceae bacterium]